MEARKIKEYAADVQSATKSLLSIINDILDFSKIESGKMELVPVEYDFSSMIHDAVNMIMMKAENKGLKTVVSVEKTIPSRLFGDEGRIRQILINLLNNAVKYTKEGSVSLNVTGDIQDNEVCLTFVVEDTGIGIKEEDISKLFARFERIEEEKNKNIEGTGLGISITMQLLKLMDSELKVESEYGKGSRFSFVLKQWIVNNEPIGNLEERIKQHASDYKYRVSFTAPNAHVLVVDDNTINRMVFINLLKQTKIQIDEAKSGMECLEKVQEKRYDLIFLDHMMPEMDGVETLHHMKAMDTYPCKDTPVIALTANAISGAHEMYLKEGFTEYLSKPIQPEKLEKMIVSMLPQELVEEYETVDCAGNDESISLPDVDGIDWDIALQHASNLENLNSVFINEGLKQSERLEKLNQIAISQMKILCLYKKRNFSTFFIFKNLPPLDKPAGDCIVCLWGGIEIPRIYEKVSDLRCLRFVFRFLRFLMPCADSGCWHLPASAPPSVAAR